MCSGHDLRCIRDTDKERSTGCHFQASDFKGTLHYIKQTLYGAVYVASENTVITCLLLLLLCYSDVT